MHERMSLRDNRRLEMARSEVASGVQAYRDTLALEYALGLSSGEAEALAQDLVRLRDSKDGFAAVSYRLLRAVHARRRLNDDSPELNEQSQRAYLGTPLRARLNSRRKDLAGHGVGPIA